MRSRAIISGQPEKGAIIAFADPGRAFALADSLEGLADSWRLVVADIPAPPAGAAPDAASDVALAFAIEQLRRIPMGVAVLVGAGAVGSRLAAAVARALPSSCRALFLTDEEASASLRPVPSSAQGEEGEGAPGVRAPAVFIAEDALPVTLRELLDSAAEAEIAHPWILPEIEELIAANPQAPHMDLATARERGERMNPPMDPPADCEFVIEELAGVENRIMTPAGKRTGLVLFVIHGGGYVMGSARFEDQRCADILRSFTPPLFGGSDLAVTTVVPEYALAPEHPHPAGLEDTLASLRAVFERYPDTPIILYGDSAGSGMANQVLRRLGSVELERIRGAILLEPCLDPAFDSLSTWENREGPGWTRQLAVDSWRAYLGDGAKPWEIHPPVRELPAEFPPIQVFVNAADPLRDEALEWAFDLARAGVKVELHSFPGTTHGWLSVPGTQIWERVKGEMRSFFEFCLKEELGSLA